MWSTDITYVPLACGFMYLAAIIDWFSRYVLAWRLSNTLDGSFCLDMLEEALSRGRPEVFNTDQGVQFTAAAWTGRLESAGVAVSMDGKGRCLDNVFVERLWRTVKYEDIYLQRYEVVPQLLRGWGGTSRTTTKIVFISRWTTGPQRRSTRRGGAEVGGMRRHSFSPRTPSAPVKGVRGEKECRGAGRGFATWESGVLQDGS